MPRLQHSITDSCFYLYESEQDARMATPKGGTGFLISYHIPNRKRRAMIPYAVTAKHVVTQGFKWARFNRSDGGTWVGEIEGWCYAAGGDDLAVAPFLDGPDDLNTLCMDWWDVLTKPEDCEELDIGLGSPVCMMGRLKNHDGRWMNTPAVRFGNISMMPGEPVKNRKTGLGQVSFLVEMHSVSGFSGSPVLVYDDHGAPDSLSVLLGVDWGHLPPPDGQTNADNAGIACVVPAWVLYELLTEDECVVKQRRELTERYPEPMEET